ncbi:hypothetical protein [Nocardia sp. XZ_19_385]|uniref:hypothetical protein n=1 Tax=Nocardia sp. XZ_19_385 TaxID=2769488 RepID=UPI00188F300E|nr:hypothetical protein [Nocardia sp. XZ_19_385]
MRKAARILVTAVMLGALASCDTASTPPGSGDPAGPVIEDTAEPRTGNGTGTGNGGGGGAKGIPIDLGPQNFGEGVPVESVEGAMRARIATGCRAEKLADDCVKVGRQIDNSAPTPSCFASPDAPRTGAFLAYVGMSKTLPAGGEGPKAELNAGETLVIYAKQCEPDEIIDTDTGTTPPTTTTTTEAETTTPPEPTTTTTTQPGG